MTPAIEYLVRTDLIKEWLVLPTSIFLFDNSDNYRKIVVTINNELDSKDYCSVKKWHLDLCSSEQDLPFMKESRVPISEVFFHPDVVLENHHLISYKQEVINTNNNSFRHPMSFDLYDQFFQNTFGNKIHNQKRTNWLWKEFVSIYAPNLCNNNNYINTYYFENSIADEQRRLVSKYKKKEWGFWRVWQKHLLLNPGELIFSKEYMKTNN